MVKGGFSFNSRRTMRGLITFSSETHKSKAKVIWKSFELNTNATRVELVSTLITIFITLYHRLSTSARFCRSHCCALPYEGHRTLPSSCNTSQLIWRMSFGYYNITLWRLKFLQISRTVPNYHTPHSAQEKESTFPKFRIETLICL